ncbi:hypothetical protein KC320_g33 [Hortaea werneckii]|nr:hypothetical protein KC320_g33 [Hortaea werneckii]
MRERHSSGISRDKRRCCDCCTTLFSNGDLPIGVTSSDGGVVGSNRQSGHTAAFRSFSTLAYDDLQRLVIIET